MHAAECAFGVRKLYSHACRLALSNLSTLKAERSRFGIFLLDNRFEEVMPFKRSKNRAINFLQACGWSVVWDLNYLRDHIKGLVISENAG